MNRKHAIIFRLCLLLLPLYLFPAFANEPTLVSNPPHDYVVQPGDTLWHISEKFLASPWHWKTLWRNNPTIHNPNRIYPGDRLVLRYYRGKPYLTVDGHGTVKLSPHIRQSSLEHAIPTIPLNIIKPFLNYSQVVDDQAFQQAPYVVGNSGKRAVASAGDHIYVRQIPDRRQEAYAVVMRGEPYLDPHPFAKKILGYNALYIGQANLVTPGDPATLLLVDVKREVQNGFYLLPIHEDQINPYFYPRAPKMQIDAQIIAVLDGVTRIGKYHVVAINRGRLDRVEIGDVLAIEQRGEKVSDPHSFLGLRRIQLPSQRIGELMVFRTFDHVSLALIMRANNVIHIFDRATNPEDV